MHALLLTIRTLLPVYMHAMKAKPLQIGPVQLKTPLMLAPMAGYTDTAFRSVCRTFDCPLAFTEVTMAEGVAREVPQAMYYLAAEPDDTPLVAHIYGSDPEVMADAAEVIEGLGRFAFIDVNCGCPVRKIQRKGAGVALMREPEKIGAIVQAMTDRVSLPVTVKTRLGLTPDQYNIETVARIAQDAGAAALFIHARVASAKHAGPPDWPFLRRIKEQCTIPVIGNGGVTSPEEADVLLESSGVDGVMIGRGAVGAPWLFKAITAHWNNQPYESPSPEEQLEVVEYHLRLLMKHVFRENEYRRKQHVSAERVTCLRFRAHLARYMRGYPGWRDLMREFNQLDSIEAALDKIRRLLLQR